NLQQCIKEEYVLEKVYRILGFEQSPWVELYIAMNTQRRAKAKNIFEKDFWKLMNNSVFGKTMEDIRKQVNIDLVRQWIINDEGKHVLKNTKVIDKWKDKNGGDRVIGYAGVHAKCYNVVCENS
ncbi:6363_t:CDS:2, partial [Dentiscutata erythropus]